MLYDGELLDRAAIIRWYTSLPAADEGEPMPLPPPADAAAADAPDISRAKLLREHASPLIIELATEESAAAVEELHRQIQASEARSSSNSSSSSTSLSTPCVPGSAPTAGGKYTGSLTPVSDECLALLPTPNSEPVGKGGARGLVTTSTSYVSVMCRTGSALSLGHEGIARQLSMESATGTLAASVATTNGSSRARALAAEPAAIKPIKQVTFAAL
ncbi:hypothetical protein IWW55_004352 [Coemansia sp. RSA 2706]|nr:hypothetical protein IWW55_004352 [Coemansia sp. RSA 2706]KAJ2323289.1 hypothetical protein IWW51_003828 [Coemansia sp. RSA 2702]